MNIKGVRLFRLTLVLVAYALPIPVPAQDIVVTEMRIPTHSSGKKGLEAVMVRPNDSQRHPLALLTHGSPRQADERPEMTPLAMIPQAREFARRGWTAVVVLRRGYGDSGGGYSEDAHACSPRPDFNGSAREAVKDLREATAYLVTRPEVDSSRMIGIGISAGGFAMVALASDPPPGMVAAISFAGGRGSNAPDHVCNAEALVGAFGDLGKHAKIPMLWVYAANDHFFSPQLAQAFYTAYSHNGGKATFFAADPFGTDGHHLFSARGIPRWTPIVDDYLKSQNLVLRDSLLPLAPTTVDPPAYLSGRELDEFHFYLLGAPHKAFAVSSDGHVGTFFGQRTAAEAQKHALQNCQKATENRTPCTLLLSDDQPAGN
ncbi:MAG TPA: CocE/NonD family hydrolase [Verrucomicrobiae bacterium]|nr:CocE/NonD family hydrolase [Verrucomicrobiae bacterium]